MHSEPNSTGLAFTAGVDSKIVSWRIPPLKQDPYEELGRCSHFRKSIYRHEDAVWNLCVHPKKHLLFSAAADGKVKAWKFDEDDDDNALRYFVTHTKPNAADPIIPTSLCMLATDSSKLLVGYVSGEVGLVDIESGKMITVMQPQDAGEFNESSGGVGALWASSQAGKNVTGVTSHPTTSLALSANIDQCVRFFDTKKGSCVDVMRAHRDAVTCVSIDPSGQLMMSASHDQSVRFWDLNTKKIIQDLDPHHTHSKKFDESVHSVVYHATMQVLASGGADSVVKIYS